jgi:hypothetical protein
MRTTLTIDDDIALKLKAESQKKDGKSFKEVVNETLRLGLLARKESSENAVPLFRVRSRRMGVTKGLNYDNIGELLDQIEEPHQ